uniref:Carotenoid-binding protein n=7 Tax=Bombyx TaxID=7090 RepID=E5RSC7_BOMMA|nr:carotenoid-binding protein [Bombyx mandarina]BAJ46581.1 carotenoid-binding protein [Bombyx mandarina]
MADSTSKSAPKINEETAERQLNELINVDSHDEYENRLSRISSALANWMKSVFNMDTTTKEEFDPVWLSIDEYKSQANESMANAWRIITLPNWTVEKRGTVRGDVVESRKVEGFGKVYRFTGVVNCPARFLYEEFKNNLTKLPEWNPTILKCEIIKEIGDGVDLSYQVTAGGGRGIITPRDFVILRRTALLSREGRVVDDNPHGYISSGVSVQVPGYPPLKEMVRGHNKVGCWYLQPRTVHTPGGKIEDQALFQWLMCCDLKGKIPQFVLDVAFATVMLDYIVHVRKFVAEAKARAEF